MVTLLDTLSILLPSTVLDNYYGDSWIKTLQYLVCQIEVSFICSVGIFSDRETLELFTISLSFEDLLPRLTFTCLCFICGTVSLVFICDYHKCCTLSGPYFLASGWMSLPISMPGLPHMSFNFPAELFHLILCDCHTVLFH